MSLGYAIMEPARPRFLLKSKRCLLPPVLTRDLNMAEQTWSRNGGIAIGYIAHLGETRFLTRYLINFNYPGIWRVQVGGACVTCPCSASPL